MSKPYDFWKDVYVWRTCKCCHGTGRYKMHFLGREREWDCIPCYSTGFMVAGKSRLHFKNFNEETVS